MFCVFCMQNGAGSSAITILSSSYLPSYLGFDFVQLGIIIVCTLLSGAFGVYGLTRGLNKYPSVSTKRIWFGVICLWLLIDLLAVLFLPPLGTTPSDNVWMNVIITCMLGGVLGGVGFASFFAIIWPGFVPFCPSRRIAQYNAMLYSVQNLGLIPEGFIYLGVLQASNRFRLALMTLIPWVVLALLTMILTDFDKGRAAAEEFDRQQPSEGDASGVPSGESTASAAGGNGSARAASMVPATPVAADASM